MFGNLGPLAEKFLEQLQELNKLEQERNDLLKQIADKIK